MPLPPFPADLDFHCTQCGRCCEELWLPLAMSEAVDWLRDGNPVAVFCQAIPWPGEPADSDEAAQYKRARSFAAMAGALPVRVLVSLAAPQGNHCPNLQADKRCAIYARRPSVCRAYPAEPNPLLRLRPQQRRCPPECWQSGGDALLRGGEYVDPELRRLLSAVVNRAVAEAGPLQNLCATLDIHVAALANEGFAIHLPAPEILLAALTHPATAPRADRQEWRFISHRATSIEAIHACGATCQAAETADGVTLQYIALSGDPPADPAKQDRQ